MLTRFFSTVCCAKETGVAHEMINTYIDGGLKHQYDTGAINTSQGTQLPFHFVGQQDFFFSVSNIHVL